MHGEGDGSSLCDNTLTSCVYLGFTLSAVAMMWLSSSFDGLPLQSYNYSFKNLNLTLKDLQFPLQQIELQCSSALG